MSLIAGDQVGEAVGDRVDSPGAVDLEEEQVDLLLPRLLDAAGQVRDHHRVERPSSLIQAGRIVWPRVGSSTADWPPIW